MAVAFAILTLLGAVVVSSVIARAAAPLVPLPLPFAQIALGGLISIVFDLRVAIEPELFLLVFIAPLLFLDGWRLPKEGLLEDKWAIGALALGLVLFTVLGAGFFIHWLIPEMPPAVSFALAAILSPTDAVAVAAIAQRSPIPQRLLHLLEGEALLNDAPGLVCMRFAIAAALTGTFSFAEASYTFLGLAAGGLTVGAAVALLANAAKDWISQHFGEETGSQILLSLLIPFAAYLLAVRIQASGILAAVTAGVAMNYEERTGRASSVTRIRRAAVWDAVQFAGNGAIFVLLGQQLPAILSGAKQVVRETGHATAWWLLGYVLAITTVLLILRAVWVRITGRLLLWRSSDARRDVWKPGWRLTAATSLAGARGALTLSGIMSLPVTLSNGTAFPARDLAILLAAGVIIVSLLATNVTLPYLAPGLTVGSDPLDCSVQEGTARLAAARAAITALEGGSRESPQREQDAALHAQAVSRLIERYQRRIEAFSNAADIDTAHRFDAIERALRMQALRAERAEYYRIAQSGRLSDQSLRALVREIDLQETRLAGR